MNSETSALKAACRTIVLLAAAWTVVGPAAAADDSPSSPGGILDSVLEKLDFKAKPSDPAPDFVVKTRPDSSTLEFMQRSMPHKVSPEPVKSPDEVQAAKDALDAAHRQQLGAAKPPVALVKPKASAAAKPSN